MAFTVVHVSMSLDGFLAGPQQSREHPIGIRGHDLHRWHMGEIEHEGDQRAAEHLGRDRGAYVMGRNMFGPIRGEWEGDWQGWWGEEPPYHAPVFVLTHYPREPLELRGGTTFHFITGGFAEAYREAVAAAGKREVMVAGGASTIQQAFAAGVVDELVLDIAPVLLGSGEALFAGVADPGLEPVEVIHSPKATHVTFRVAREARDSQAGGAR